MATSGEQPGPLDALDARLGHDAALRKEILDLAKRLERRGFRFRNMSATAQAMLQRGNPDGISIDDLDGVRKELQLFYAIIMRREQEVVGRIQQLKRQRIIAAVGAFLVGSATAFGVQQLQSRNSGEVVAQRSVAVPGAPPGEPSVSAAEPPATRGHGVSSPPSRPAPSPPPVRKSPPPPAVKKRAAARHQPHPASPAAPEKPHGDGTIRTLTDANFEAQTTHGFWVVDFWAEWCSPCRNFAPAFDSVAAGYGRKVQFGRFNVDPDNDGAFNATAHRFEVEGIPSVLFLKNGRVVVRAGGRFVPTGEDVTDTLKRFGY